MPPFLSEPCPGPATQLLHAAVSQLAHRGAEQRRSLTSVQLPSETMDRGNDHPQPFRPSPLRPGPGGAHSTTTQYVFLPKPNQIRVQASLSTHQLEGNTGAGEAIKRRGRNTTVPVQAVGNCRTKTSLSKK